jgi:hypothetical protein
MMLGMMLNVENVMLRESMYMMILLHKVWCMNMKWNKKP